MNYLITTNYLELEEFLSPILDGKRHVLAFDVETNGLNYLKHKVLGLSFSFKEGSGVYVPIYYTGKEEITQPLIGILSEDNYQAILKLIKTILTAKNILKVAHNYSFDVKMIKSNFGFRVQPIVFDTMLADHILNENRSHALESLKKIYFPELVEYTTKLSSMITKAELERTGYLSIPLEVLGPYACADTDATYRLAMMFSKALKNV